MPAGLARAAGMRNGVWSAIPCACWTGGSVATLTGNSMCLRGQLGSPPFHDAVFRQLHVPAGLGLLRVALKLPLSAIPVPCGTSVLGAQQAYPIYGNSRPLRGQRFPQAVRRAILCSCGTSRISSICCVSFGYMGYS